MIYIGGNEQTFEFDFSTKTAGIIKECPMNLYCSIDTKINTPLTRSQNMNDFNSCFALWEKEKQYIFDKFSKKDGAYEYFTSGYANEKYAQLMVELDLNPLAQDLFGGSTDALKNAIKSMEVDIYTFGSGIKDGQQVNGANIAWFDFGTNDWKWTRQDYSNSIERINKNVGREYNIHQSISSENKVYILISALYPSDENKKIASVINLDYFNIKITLKKEADNTMSIPIDLTDTWSILGSIFPNYDSNLNEFRYIFSIRENDDKCISMYYRKETNNIILNVHDGKNSIEPNKIDFNKLANIRFLLCCHKNKFTLDLLVNGKIYSFETSKTENITLGNVELSIGRLFKGALSQFDGFIENFQYMPNKTWTQEETKEILKGTHKYFYMPNLFNINKTFTGRLDNGEGNKTTVINSNSIKTEYAYSKSGTNSLFWLDVLPNNKYEISADIIGKGYITVDEYLNKAKQLHSYENCLNENNKKIIITTSNNTNKLRIWTMQQQHMKVPATIEYNNINIKLIP